MNTFGTSISHDRCFNNKEPVRDRHKEVTYIYSFNTPRSILQFGSNHETTFGVSSTSICRNYTYKMRWHCDR